MVVGKKHDHWDHPKLWALRRGAAAGIEGIGAAQAPGCHDSCLKTLIEERHSECFTKLQHAGHTCEDLMGLILSAMSLNKVRWPHRPLRTVPSPPFLTCAAPMGEPRCP